MMSHRLEPLLRPRSVAVIGASAKRDSMGAWALENLRRGGFSGKIFPVNPRYDDIDGLTCYPGVAGLPERPDLVIFAIGDARLEQALDEVIAARIPAAVIMTALVLDDDVEPPLKQRVGKKIVSAGMLVCGANGMGFYNVRDQVWACGFDSKLHAAPGKVSIISHSGSGMSGIIDCEQRLQINIAVSTGNEIGVTMDEYLDFVLDLPETSVVGLFVETARNPEGFRNALRKARDRRIPIVALKVGRTRKARELTVSHSGAMAGDDAAYDALFDRYGVQRVSDQDEWTQTLILFAELRSIGKGGLVALHDSGGERQLLIDLAADLQVPLTELGDKTVAALKTVLEPELPAVNPLDAWSRGGADAGKKMTECLSLMMQDDEAAIGAVMHDRAPDGKIYPSYLAYMQRAHAESGKPVALVSATAGSGHDEAVVTSTHAGFPVLDGVRSFLVGVRALFAYRDFQLRVRSRPDRHDHIPASDVVNRWAKRLGAGVTLSEAESLAMLDEFGIATTRPLPANDLDSALAAARKIGYPVVLKTAAPGVLHKTDCGGVRLNIVDEASLQIQYQDVAEQLGRDVLVSQLVSTGVELILGVRRDPQFGPIVLIGSGGVLAEAINDVVFAMPPIDADHARRCIDRLKVRPLLDGMRGRPAVNLDSVCELAAKFSSMVDSLRDVIAEIDINPLIMTGESVIAVDALIVGRNTRDHADT